VLLSDWTTEFVLQGDGDAQDGIWTDIVEDYVPVPNP
jgi:hypothetical protein